MRRAANGFKAHREIVAQERPKGVARQCYTRLASEHAICRSEVRRKGVAGTTDTQCRGHPTCLLKHFASLFSLCLSFSLLFTVVLEAKCWECREECCVLTSPGGR